MTDHPIIFQDWSIRAIRAGTKTQTRRVVIPQPVSHDEAEPNDLVFMQGELCKVKESRGWGASRAGLLNAYPYKCPHGEPGDTLWVRETHYRFTGCSLPPSTWIKSPDDNPYQARGYIGEDENDAMHENAAACVKVPSIHMPRWASRISLTVKDRRVERVQDISEADAIAEGSLSTHDPSGCSDWAVGFAEACFRTLWDSINTKPRARMRGGKIAFYESFPWDGERETREYRGKPWHVYPNPAVWRVEWPPYQAASI